MQEKRVLRESEGNAIFRPDNPSGLDRDQEKRIQSDKYAPLPNADPSDGGLENAEMEQRGFEKK